MEICKTIKYQHGIGHRHFNNHRNMVQLHPLEMGMGKHSMYGLHCHKLHTPLEHSYDFTASKATENLPHKFSHHIPFHGPTTGGPPPLISTLPQTVNPFYLKKLAGNIRTCQGCRDSLHLADETAPSPPYDMI